MSDSSQILRIPLNVPFSMGKLYRFQECHVGKHEMWECRTTEQHNQSIKIPVQYRHRDFLSPVRARKEQIQ